MQSRARLTVPPCPGVYVNIIPGWAEKFLLTNVWVRKGEEWE